MGGVVAAAICTHLAGWNARVWAGEGVVDPLLRVGAVRRLEYRMGWSGMTAARAALEARVEGEDRVTLRAEAGTIGVPRVLWQFDGRYESEVRVRDFGSVRSELVEEYRRKSARTDLEFDAGGVTQVRVDEKGGGGVEVGKKKRRDGEGIRDLFGAGLRIREMVSGAAGGPVVVDVFPGNSLYRVTLQFSGREKLRCGMGVQDAIRMSLEIMKVERDGSLKPHRLFRRGTIWFSAGGDRLPLRAEVEIFIGKIFAELTRVENPGGG